MDVSVSDKEMRVLPCERWKAMHTWCIMVSIEQVARVGFIVVPIGGASSFPRKVQWLILIGSCRSVDSRQLPRESKRLAKKL